MKINFILLTLIILSPLSILKAQNRIEDNSILIEEAYNQEEGVIQHIGTFNWNDSSRDREGTFTQEWPLFSHEHQGSYTIPFFHTSEEGNDIGDILLNYRYQLLHDERVAFAPRFSLAFPTGDEEKGYGTNHLGYQLNLPLSFVATEKFVFHWNLGATITPNHEAPTGEIEDTFSPFYGASVIYLADNKFNLLLEFLGTSDEAPSKTGTQRDDTFVLNPGARFAIDIGETQIVPAVSIPIGLGASEGEWGVITYISIEHPIF